MSQINAANVQKRPAKSRSWLRKALCRELEARNRARASLRGDMAKAEGDRQFERLAQHLLERLPAGWEMNISTEPKYGTGERLFRLDLTDHNGEIGSATVYMPLDSELQDIVGRLMIEVDREIEKGMARGMNLVTESLSDVVT